MIELNMLIPGETEDEIFFHAQCGKDFRVINSNIHWKNKQHYYLVETTEEYYTIFKLKYGNNVWKR